MDIWVCTLFTRLPHFQEGFFNVKVFDIVAAYKQNRFMAKFQAKLYTTCCLIGLKR